MLVNHTIHIEARRPIVLADLDQLEATLLVELIFPLGGAHGDGFNLKHGLEFHNVV